MTFNVQKNHFDVTRIFTKSPYRERGASLLPHPPPSLCPPPPMFKNHDYATVYDDDYSFKIIRLFKNV